MKQIFFTSGCQKRLDSVTLRQSRGLRSLTDLASFKVEVEINDVVPSIIILLFILLVLDSLPPDLLEHIEDLLSAEGVFVSAQEDGRCLADEMTFAFVPDDVDDLVLNVSITNRDSW
jgi:hypothetical protein